jgi:hypothetical protein
MMRTVTVIIILNALISEIHAQVGVLSGKITDATTGESLIGATIM